MTINTIPTVDIQDFEKEHGLNLVVKEREKYFMESAKIDHRYYCSFNNLDIREGSLLLSTSGNGNTIDEAIEDYCSRIGGREVVIGAYTEQRKEFKSPYLTHSKKLNK